MEYRPSLPAEETENTNDRLLMKCILIGLQGKGERNAIICTRATTNALCLVGIKFRDKALRKEYSDLLDGLTQFFVRTPAEHSLASLEQRWQQCNCGGPPDGLIQKLHQPREEFPTSLAQVLYVVIDVLNYTILHVNLEKLVGAASSTKWPQSLKQLMPTGPDSVVGAAVHWIEFMKNEPSLVSAPFLYLAMLMEICPSLRRPVITSKKLLQHFVDVLVQQIDLFIGHTLVPTYDLPPHGQSNLHDLFDYYNIVDSSVSELLEDGEYTYWKEHSMRLYNAMARLRAMPESELEVFNSEERHHEKFLEMMHHSFWMTMPTDSRPENVKWPHWDAAVMSLSSRPDTMLFTLIEQFEELYMCAGPSCLRRAEELEKPLRKCQRCRLLRYCSTDCQLEGWNWQQSPHKITCKMIPRFTAILGNVNETHGHIDNVSERIYRAVEDAGVSWHDGDLVATALSKLIFLREAIERT